MARTSSARAGASIQAIAVDVPGLLGALQRNESVRIPQLTEVMTQ
jgi:hypothetical protein